MGWDILGSKWTVRSLSWRVLVLLGVPSMTCLVPKIPRKENSEWVTSAQGSMTHKASPSGLSHRLTTVEQIAGYDRKHRVTAYCV